MRELFVVPDSVYGVKKTKQVNLLKSHASCVCLKVMINNKVLVYRTLQSIMGTDSHMMCVCVIAGQTEASASSYGEGKVG